MKAVATGSLSCDISRLVTHWQLSIPLLFQRFIAVLIVFGGASVGCGERDAPSRPDAGAPFDAGSGDASSSDANFTPSEVGEPCAGPIDCVEDATCIGTTSGEFVCMARCDEPYSACDDDSVCTPVSDGTTNVCYIGGSLQANEVCASNLECEPGLLCFGTGEEFYCREACDAGTGAGCLPGEYCRALGSGAAICRPVLGEACATSADCPAAGLTCITEINSGWEEVFPGGYCTQTCMSDEDCSIGSKCASIETSNERVCVRPCDHVSDCRFNEGYRCVAAEECGAESDPALCEALTGGSKACLP